MKHEKRARWIVMAMAAVLPLAALCETNITEDVVLTGDADWRAEGIANISGTVNLNGHKLYTAGVAGSGLVFSAANTNTYKYYRYKCDETQCNNFQVCEIEFLGPDGTKITETPAAILWDSSGHTYSSYRPEKAFDGSLKTEWYDHRMSDGKVWVTVEYSEPLSIAGYRWYVGLDTNEDASRKQRNPVSWRLQASNDNENWTDLDVVTGASCTTVNKALAYSIIMGEESELHVEIPEGEAHTNSTLKLSGPVKLVKDGAGTLVLSKSGQSNCLGVRVSAGILKPGLSGRDSNTIFGVPKPLESEIEIEIERGGQFLDDIYCNGSLYNIHWVIAGDGPDGSGAIRTVAKAVNKVNNANVPWGARLTLSDDATINSEEYAFDFINDYYTTFYLELNGHTLNVTGKSSGRQWPYFLLSSVQSVGEGTLAMENLVFYPYKTVISQLVGTTVVISETASYYTDHGGDVRNVTMSNLVYRSTAANAQQVQITTVLATYAPVSTNSAPKVVLGDATHLETVLDLSERTTPFDIATGGGLTFASGRRQNRQPPRRFVETDTCLDFGSGRNLVFSFGRERQSHSQG